MVYKLLAVFALLGAACLCLYAIDQHRKLDYVTTAYADFVTLTDAALAKQAVLTMPVSCYDQLANADMVQIKIIR